METRSGVSRSFRGISPQLGTGRRFARCLKISRSSKRKQPLVDRRGRQGMALTPTLASTRYYPTWIYIWKTKRTEVSGHGPVSALWRLQS